MAIERFPDIKRTDIRRMKVDELSRLLQIDSQAVLKPLECKGIKCKTNPKSPCCGADKKRYSKILINPKINCKNIKIGKFIGKGEWGSVNQFCCDKACDKYVIKTINFKQGTYGVRELNNEVKIQNLASQAGVSPKIIRVMVHSSRKNADIVMEYAGKSVYKLMKKMTLGEKVAIFKKIIDQIIKLHSAGIVARDIHLENVLMRKKSIKIIDYGWADLLKNYSRIDREEVIEADFKRFFDTVQDDLLELKYSYKTVEKIMKELVNYAGM
jgi:tRNA A-37 threonylcarbamoyl transferase component Bud32